MNDIPVDRAPLIEVWRLPHWEYHIETLQAEFRSGRLAVYGFRSGATLPERVPPGCEIDWIGPKQGENRGPFATEGVTLFFRLFAARSDFDFLCPEPILSPRPLNSRTRTNRAARAEQAAAEWLREHAVNWERARRDPKLRLRKQAAFEAAKETVKSIGPLSKSAFLKRVWPTYAHTEWKKQGAPSGLEKLSRLQRTAPT